MFDIIGYFTDRNVSFITSGPNVGRDHINITCYWCADSSKHLGIHQQTGGFNCWICGKTGKFYEIIREVEGKRYIDFKLIYSQYGDGTYVSKDKKIIDVKTGLVDVCEIENKEGLQYKMLEKWLKKRKFSIEDVCDWDCYLADSLKHFFSYRLVIPIEEDYKDVCYVGRDLTGKSENRYKATPNGSSPKQYQECLYNIDDMQNKKGVIIVEGPTDVWRLSKQRICRNYAVIAVFGKVVTKEQLNLLLPRIKEMIEVIVCFDGESLGGSSNEAYNLINSIFSFTDNISEVRLKIGDDPDEACLKGYFEQFFCQRRRIF